MSEQHFCSAPDSATWDYTTSPHVISLHAPAPGVYCFAGPVRQFPFSLLSLSARLLWSSVTGSQIRDVPAIKSYWNVSTKRTSLIAMALLEAASRRRKAAMGRKQCTMRSHRTNCRNKGVSIVYCVGMVSVLQKQVRPQHQTQAMSRAADGQYGHASTGTTWSSEAEPREDSFPSGSSPTHSYPPPLPASILEAKLRGIDNGCLTKQGPQVCTSLHACIDGVRLTIHSIEIHIPQTIVVDLLHVQMSLTWLQGRLTTP